MRFNRIMLANWPLYLLVALGLALAIGMAVATGLPPGEPEARLVGRAGAARIYRFDYEGRTYLIVKGLGMAITEHKGAADD